MPNTLTSKLQNRIPFKKSSNVEFAAKNELNQPLNQFTDKEKYFQATIDEATTFFKDREKTPTTISWVEKCLDTKNNSNIHSPIGELAHNKGTWFTVEFPRGFQKALALGFIMERPLEAFTSNGTFNLEAFTTHLSEYARSNPQNQKKYNNLINNLNKEYFKNIKLDTRTEIICFGKKNYRNLLSLPGNKVQNVIPVQDLTKKDLIRHIFIDKKNGSSGSNEEVIKEVLNNLSQLAKHQSIFSKSFGFSIPKSLQIVACELAKRFGILLTEHNLAKLLYLVCTSRDTVDCNEKLLALAKESVTKTSEVITSSDPNINNVLKVTQFILNSTNTGHFKNTINEAKTEIYRNSHDTNYKVNNLFNKDIELFNEKHFTFWSGKTHTASGLVGLSTSGQRYNQSTYLKSVPNAIANLGTITELHINGELQKTETYLDLEVELPNILKKLCPEDGISRKNAIEFYQNPDLKLEFTVNTGNKYVEKYIIKPILTHDKINDHYFVHWEFGTQDSFNKIPPAYMFNFSGNMGTVPNQFISASYLLNSTNTIQILMDYPNKGLNHILNPGLTARNISIKGSINPHLAAYNYYCKKHNNNFALEMKAHSYGNLAGVQFIKQILKEHIDRKILFIGSGTAASLVAVAKSYVGKGIGTLADHIKMLNRSDVFEELVKHKNNVKALIFNNVADMIIKEPAQLQTHPNFKNNLQEFANEPGIQRITHENITVAIFNDPNHGHNEFFGYGVIGTNPKENISFNEEQEIFYDNENKALNSKEDFNAKGFYSFDEYFEKEYEDIKNTESKQNTLTIQKTTAIELDKKIYTQDQKKRYIIERFLGAQFSEDFKWENVPPMKEADEIELAYSLMQNLKNNSIDPNKVVQNDGDNIQKIYRPDETTDHQAINVSSALVLDDDEIALLKPLNHDNSPIEIEKLFDRIGYRIDQKSMKAEFRSMHPIITFLINNYMPKGEIQKISDMDIANLRAKQQTAFNFQIKAYQHYTDNKELIDKIFSKIFAVRNKSLQIKEASPD